MLIFKGSINKNYYMTGLGNTSKRIIPKKLIYMGNYDLFRGPIDEEKEEFKDMYVCSEWRYLDEHIFNKLKKNFLSSV